MVEGELTSYIHRNDLMIVVSIGRDGKYYFQAGTICLPGKSSRSIHYHSHLLLSTWSLNPTRHRTHIYMHILLTISPPKPGFWRMQDKIGLPLDDIHILGNVPQCTLFCFVVFRYIFGIFMMRNDCLCCNDRCPRVQDWLGVRHAPPPQP